LLKNHPDGLCAFFRKLELGDMNADANTTPRPLTADLAEISDEALLTRYRDVGDLTAFEGLVHRYERPLFSYLSRYLRSAPLAEEVFQATLLRVHEKCSLFSADRRFRPWLYSIATHQAIDALRKEKRHRAVSLNEEHGVGDAEPAKLLELLESRVPTPPERLEQRERAQWTRQAVDELADDLRVVILLIFFQGLRYQEAAEALYIPIGTVKSRVHRALLRLNEAWWNDHPHG
jgi:RNA polymerase sigma-70 factor (ECF subfamily)